MKKYIRLIFTAFLFFCGKCFAQFNPVWNHDYQHTNTSQFSNESRKVAVDASGNVFVLADATSDKDPNGVITGSTYDYTILLKYSAGGTLMNTLVVNVDKHFVSGFDNRGAFGLEVDATGNVYAGYSSHGPSTDFDINLVKYNNSLAVVWSYNYNAASIDSGIDMKVVSGFVYAIIKSNAGGNIRYRVLKASSTLTTSTPLYSFNTNPDVLNALTVDASQNIYVTGHRTVAGSKNILSASLTSAGVLRWTNVYNGGNNNFDDIGKNLSIGADGFVYMTGTSDRANINGLDVLTIKYNAASGKREWISYQNYGTTDGGFFVTAPDTNFVYVFSVSANTILIDQLRISSGGGGGVGSGGIGGALVHRIIYNPVPVAAHTNPLNGASINDMKVSVNKSFYITGSILATNAGQLFSAGYLAKINFNARVNGIEYAAPILGDFNGSIKGVGVAINNPAADVIWVRDFISTYANHQLERIEIVDYGVPVIREASPPLMGLSKDSKISLAPNPAVDFITVYPSEEITKIELFDLVGKAIQTGWINSTNPVINLSLLKPGIYIAKITSASGTVSSHKIIKNNY